MPEWFFVSENSPPPHHMPGQTRPGQGSVPCPRTDPPPRPVAGPFLAPPYTAGRDYILRRKKTFKARCKVF